MQEKRPYRVIESYPSPYPAPIIFHKGDIVTIGREFEADPDWQNWCWCETPDEREAWVPRQLLKVQEDTGIFLRDYNAVELTVDKGEILMVSEVINGFGWSANPSGSTGWVPVKCLEAV